MEYLINKIKMDFTVLYNNQDKDILKTAEDSLNRAMDRIQEIIDYSKQASLKKIGIANCTTFNKEADILEKMLINEGFKVAKLTISRF